jgi:hypothetical protein
MVERFREQIRELEEEREAVDRLRKASNAIERQKAEASTSGGAVNGDELDLVPTKGES